MKEFITTYKGGMAFEADVFGQKVLMDAHESVGGANQGPLPKPLVLAALSGCTGMDVASILNKMKVEEYDLEIRIAYEMTEEHPKMYTKLHLTYAFSGKDLPEDKLKKAVKLSQEKYCGVSAMLEKALELTYEITIN